MTSKYGCGGTITSIPNNSGSSNRQLRWRMKAPGSTLASMQRDAAPEIKNSKPSRHGDDSIMYDSAVSLANSLWMCQPHVT